MLSAWFAYGLWIADERALWGSLPFLVLFVVSFTWVGLLSVGEWWQSARAVREPAPLPAVEAKRA